MPELPSLSTKDGQQTITISHRSVVPLPNMKKPKDSDFWSRVHDEENDTIYYVNSLSNETRWLAPCSICYNQADKWCIQCSASYCLKHFASKHPLNEKEFQDRNIDDPSITHENISFHQWSLRELPSIETDEEICVDCNRRVATKLCSICWDAYCQGCFERVHHVGFLRDHKALNLKRARLTWYILPSDSGETYVNGFTGEKRTEKPVELMTDVERALLQNWTSHQKTMEEFSERAEELEKQLEKLKTERDKTTVELAQLAHQIKTKIEERKKGK